MTWPFENDTSAVTGKYAKRSIRAGKIKSILSILTIMLSAALLSGFILSVIGMETESNRGWLVSNHAIYTIDSEQQMSSLRQDSRILDSRLFMQAANTEIDNYMVIPIYIEQNNSNIAVDDIIEGHYPTELYEIAVDKAFLRQVGLPLELGVEIAIPFYDGNTEKFTVVGLTDNGSSERVYSLYCSQEYTQRGSQFQQSVTALAVQLTDTNNMSSGAFKETVNAIGADYGISARKSDYNDGFAASLEPNSEVIQILVIFSLVVLFVSYLVIYSIFYIYVQNQVREFGQLRTMGATSKQIRKILSSQGKLYCVTGTSLGLVIGGTAAFLFRPNGWSWTNTILSGFSVFVLIYGMIRLAMRKPAKIAGSIPPVEAQKSTGYQTFHATSKKLHRKITPFSLAVMSGARNRKKWIITILSLGVAGIMFMSGTTLLSSLDMERFARHGLFRYGEFEIDLSRNAKRSDPHRQTGIQASNPLNEELIQAIMQIDGIHQITVYQNLDAQFEYNGDTDAQPIAPFLSDQQSLLEQYLSDGTADYESMIGNRELLILRNEYVEDIYGWKFQIGDTIKFRWYNGAEYKETEYKIAGEISDDVFADEQGGRLFGKTQFFLLPDKLLQDMMEPGFNLNSNLLIEIDNLSQEAEIRQQMNELVEDTANVTMETLYNLYLDSKVMYDRTSAVIFGISGFLMLFAVINLINTLIAVALSRKHEFSVLRAIGMGKKQLQATIRYEGLLLSLWNVFITLIFGTVTGYGIVRYLNSLGDDTWIWRFPLPYFVGYGIVSIILPIVISAVIIYIVQKKSVVEQLREFN